MNLPHLTLKNAFWMQNGLWGLAYESGTRSNHGRAENAEQAKRLAEDLGVSNGVPTDEFVLRDRATRHGVNEDRESYEDYVRRNETMQRFVCHGDADDRSINLSALSELEFDDELKAVPDGFGRLVSSTHRSAYEDRYILRVTRALAAAHRHSREVTCRRASFVVCAYNGTGVAMKLEEAYERGLREAPNWYPDLTS